MKKIHPVACLLLLSCATYAQTEIPVLLQSTLHYPQHIFDSDTCCWRQLNAAGRHAESAALIVQYLEKNKRTRNPHSLRWHAGQMFAKAGQSKQAIRYFKKTYSWFYQLGGEEGMMWYLFAKGNVAFVQRDKKQLDRIIRSWERMGFEQAENYKQLKEMSDNWERPYNMF